MGRRLLTAVAALLLAGCDPKSVPSQEGGQPVPGWVYQLQNYKDDKLDEIARTPAEYAVIDLARDARSDWFRHDEVTAVARSKKVLAYFEIGSIENFRPEYDATVKANLTVNRWDDWPEEYFVRYWEEAWWTGVIRPRLDRALAAGFDGVYLDTPLAYEEIDAKQVGKSREELAALMAALIVRISEYAKSLLIVPQNSPELRAEKGYTQAIDGIGMEELFFLATDEACKEDYCAENLDNTRALRDAGKFVLAVDYARKPENVRTACDRYRREGFTGYVTVRELDRVSASC
jgi:cysteinyl-tRNA synthetase